jgi:hypothetical protein
MSRIVPVTLTDNTGMLPSLAGDRWRLVDQFKSTYYNGLDIRIYLEDVRLADVVGLTYEIREQVLPVYGYASYTLDMALHGQRIIEGNFTILYKKPYALIEQVRRLQEAAARGAGVEQEALVAEVDLGANYDGRAVSLEDIFRWAEAQRLKYWESDRTVPYPASESEEDAELENLPLWAAGGLTLRISYNDPRTRTERYMQLLAREREMALSLPDRQDLHTLVEVLEGVEITGVGKAIEDSGRPMLESYNFIAADYKVRF